VPTPLRGVLLGVRCLLTLLFLSGFVQAQTVDRNRISLSAGWTQQIYVNTDYGQAAPTVGLALLRSNAAISASVYIIKDGGGVAEWRSGGVWNNRICSRRSR